MHFFILRIVNEGDPVLACAILERKMQRGQYDLEEDPCVDWLVHCCRDLCFVSRAQESWI
ncbi:hypothetical protein NC653_035056 [Populus alba x Populus x berolinensis]|uniref:Uncharacterized protein n=1 Tax=Populus alba x Populus x berolinensis TaxID=444605 RepID=A0AAD6PWW8_9ROSI|nr:hypothetical protein NC653_035056 [Populus alba x Populus x berolinensis]